MLLLRVTSIDEVINLTAFLPAESALQPEGLVYASLSHLSRGEMSKDGTQQVPPFELSPLRVNVARGQQGLERYFSLASSTLLRSNIS